MVYNMLCFTFLSVFLLVLNWFMFCKYTQNFWIVEQYYKKTFFSSPFTFHY